MISAVSQEKIYPFQSEYTPSRPQIIAAWMEINSANSRVVLRYKLYNLFAIFEMFSSPFFEDWQYMCETRLSKVRSTTGLCRQIFCLAFQ